MNKSFDLNQSVEIELGKLNTRNSSVTHLVKYVNQSYYNNENQVLDDIDWESHCHTIRSDITREKSTKRAYNQLIVSTFLCFLFMVIEIIGGALANSVAIMTDASHMFSDFISFLLGLFALWLSERQPTRRMSFGYYRAEVLVSLVSMIIIWIVTAILVYIAIKRIVDNDYEINSLPMLIVSGLAVAINLILGLTLSNICCFKKSENSNDSEHGQTHQSHNHSHSSHSHSHMHGHSHTNLNVRSAFIHVLGDLIQSIGVLVSALIIYFKPQYKIADPICTFIFSILVLISTFTVMRDTFFVLMESFPSNIDYNSVKNLLQTIESVENVHSLHIWSLTLNKNALSVHLAINSDIDCQHVLKNAEKLIRNKFGINETNIQVERFEPRTMNQCNTCNLF